MEVCGSDEWQIDIHEREPLVTDLFEHLQMQGLLTGLGTPWTEGRLSHSDTLECVWLLRLSCNDGTRS